MTEERIEHDICQTDAQCLHGGLCKGTGEIGTFTYCECAEGFGGARCEDFCPLQCENGGVCHPSTATTTLPSSNESSFQCKCRGYWAGETCSIPYVNCAGGSQCYNGGTCLSYANKDGHIMCDCPVLFAGISCEIHVPLKGEHEEVQIIDPALKSPHFVSALDGFQWRNNVAPLSLIFATFGFLLGVCLYTAKRKTDDNTQHHRDDDHPDVQYSTIELESQKNIV